MQQSGNDELMFYGRIILAQLKNLTISCNICLRPPRSLQDQAPLDIAMNYVTITFAITIILTLIHVDLQRTRPHAQ